MRGAEVSLVAGFVIFTPVAVAQSTKATVPDLTGVYEIVPNNVTLPGGFKNVGSPEEIPLQPAAGQRPQTSARIQPRPVKLLVLFG